MTRFSDPVDPGEAAASVAVAPSSSAARIRDLEEALRRSEAKLRLAQEAGRLGIWEQDLRTGELTVSPTGKAHLGLPENSRLGSEKAYAPPHPDGDGRIARAWADALARGEDFEVEHRVTRTDGSVGWVMVRGHVLHDNGRPARLIGITQDLAARQRDERALEQAERRNGFLRDLTGRLRPLADPTAIMVTAASLLGGYLEVNRAGYAEVDSDTHLFIAGEWTDGRADGVARRLDLSVFGTGLVAELQRGSTLVVTDLEADPRAAGAAGLGASGARSLLAVPLVKDRRLIALLYLHQTRPRLWTEADIALAEDVAERTWAVVERARAEAELRVSEAKFRTIGEALPAFVWVLGKDMRLTYVNERWINYSGLPPDQALGFSWMDSIHPDDLKDIIVAIRDILIPNEIPYTVEARYRPPGGEYRWHLIRADPIRNARGEFTGWCGASVDIHDLKVAEAALRESAEQLRIALQAARMGNWTWDAATDRVHLPGRAAEIYGAPDPVTTWTAMQKWVHPADVARVSDAVRRAVERGEQYDIEYRVNRVLDGAPVWVAAKGQATYDPDGVLVGMTGVVQDVTDRKHAEERQQLLIRELHHRVKNTLATVQAIVSSTARTATNMDQFYQGFIGRIISLAKTHNLLTDDLWQRASLEELLRNELGPYEDKQRTRVLLEGPDVELPSEAALPIGMAVHELTTNAAKHGAFSNADGRVEVRWTVQERPGGPVLHLTWAERGGPPVRKPERQGFGSRLLQRTLAAQLQAKVEMSYDEAGVRCAIEMPVPAETGLLNPLS